MNPLFEVRNILDDFLTSEKLWMLQPDPKEIVSYSRKEKGEGEILFFNLFSYSAEIVRRKLDRDLSPEEVNLVYNRIKQFLVVRGLD